MDSVQLLFDYLKATLPPSLYSFAITILSHVQSGVAAFISLSISLMGQNPLEWKAEAILPPLITILTAYLALASLYRTASWAIRLSLFFIKWGFVFAVAMAITGYLSAQTTNVSPNLQSQSNSFSNLFGGAPSPSKHKSRTNHNRNDGPKPWHTFEYQEPKSPETNPSAKQLMDSIARAAEAALGVKWWIPALQGHVVSDSEKEKQSRGKNGKSRSR